jgi:hypothetical protein
MGMSVHALVALTWLVADVLGATTAAGEVVSTPAAAQARLAEALADADAVDAVTVRGGVVSFVIDHVGERYTLDVTTHPGGEVAAIAIRDLGPRDTAAATVGRFDWLAREATDIQTVRTLTVDDDGTVTLATGDGRRYLVIPDRHDGNSAVEARWGAEWNNS